MTEAYTELEIESHLATELPHWTYEKGWIRRKIYTSGWKATLMVVNTVGHLAEKAWHHPDLTVSYAFVIVKLVTHSAKGVTAKDFALAKKLKKWLCGMRRRRLRVFLKVRLMIHVLNILNKTHRGTVSE